MDPKKVATITDWEASKKVVELRSFLSLVNYYCKFIKGYSKFTTPLTNLLKKDQLWTWTKSYQKTFDALKRVVVAEPILRLPDFKASFDVWTD